MYLTNIHPKNYKTHYAGVGLYGELGFSALNDSLILVNDVLYPYSIGAHAPSCVTFDLGNKYDTFITKIGINHSAKDKYTGTCDYYVYADGVLVGAAPKVTVYDTPKLYCNINKCKELSLIANTNNPTHCHSVWLNPVLYTSSCDKNICCYGTHVYQNKKINQNATYCFVSVVTNDYIEYFLNLYKSLIYSLSIKDYIYVVYGIGLSEDNIKILEDIGVFVINANAICDTTNLSSKFLALDTYNIADCEYYIFLDTDMLVVDDISDVLSFITSYSSNHISICRQTDVDIYYSFKDALTDTTNNSYKDYDLTIRKLKIDQNILSFAHAINSGFYIIGREAMCKANNIISRLLPEAYEWEREKLSECWWREEAILTVCIAMMNNCNILPQCYNVQLQTKDVNYDNHGFYYNNQRCKILHMVGKSKEEKYNKILNQLKLHYDW